MYVEGVHVHPGAPCPHSTGRGCNIYSKRPIDPCVNFNCGWVIENSPLPEWLKPNNGKVIVIFNKLTWNGRPVDLAVPVGKRIPPRSLQWLKNFSKEKFRPLIYTEQITESEKFQIQQQTYGYGPPEFQQTLLAWQQEGKKLW